MLALDLAVLALAVASPCTDPIGHDRARIVFQGGWRPPLRFYSSPAMKGSPVLQLDHEGLKREGLQVCSWPRGRYDPTRVPSMVLEDCPEGLPIKAVFGDCGVGTAIILIAVTKEAPAHLGVPYQGTTLFLGRRGLPSDTAVQPPPGKRASMLVEDGHDRREEAPSVAVPRTPDVPAARSDQAVTRQTSWRPPGCEKLLSLRASRLWNSSCVRRGTTLRLDLHVNDIGEVQIQPLARLPPRVVVRTVSPSLEGFSVHTVGHEGAETLRCSSERSCEDAAFTAARADKVLGRRKVEDGSKTYDWPTSEVTVTVELPAQALANGRRLKIHWIDAYRR